MLSTELLKTHYINYEYYCDKLKSKGYKNNTHSLIGNNNFFKILIPTGESLTMLWNGLIYNHALKRECEMSIPLICSCKIFLSFSPIWLLSPGWMNNVTNRFILLTERTSQLFIQKLMTVYSDNSYFSVSFLYVASPEGNSYVKCN